MNEKAIVDFIYREAGLLDSMQWETWLELFHPEGRYWLPLEWAQEDPVLQPSLMYEDLLLLKVRVESCRASEPSAKSRRAVAIICYRRRKSSNATLTPAVSRRGPPTSIRRHAVTCLNVFPVGLPTNWSLSTTT